MCFSLRFFGQSFVKIRSLLFRLGSVLFCLGVESLLFSCASLPSGTESRSFPKEKTDYGLCGEEISVSVNLVEDRELNSQARQVARSVLADYLVFEGEGENGENDGKIPLLLKITINQRTVPVGFSSFNSLYLNCSLEDAGGKTLLNRCTFKKTKKTVESGKFLCSQVKDCCGTVKKFLKKSKKR